ncbi:uncharacterized protein PHALS_10676 [Plasmopara halstedii]|uniref:Uncharacterized protein n=1 Tax=Plasmopara halstedii TaxID=4781 RepID=A0A0P1AH52_PLAHL|nr:uncharacterized protein PHALS_10676 [Plasmopara halstedii]CEG40479.1 hypothetical protein PHALS_10676 [Plasmopara halstedii]|eukprot:XP_024576848.1 hypothetical protein PHALS_10676 [Plasmopara halstedii]
MQLTSWEGARETMLYRANVQYLGRKDVANVRMNDMTDVAGELITMIVSMTSDFLF